MKKKRNKKVKATGKAKSSTRTIKSAKSQELVIRVLPQEVVPTATDLAEPMREGKKLTIPKTWLGEAQLVKILQVTPKQYIYKKPGKGGGTFDYVTTSYITKALNYIFGWDWDFDIVEHGIEGKQVWVKGKLTVRGGKDGSRTISKTQFGRNDIKYRRDSKTEMLDFGNDMKGAASDALKKCASMFGIASDIYGKGDYKDESGVTPKPAPQPDTRTGTEKVQDAVKDTTQKYSTDTPGEICKGVSGKGCAYGNDGDALPPEVASYSKKIYGKALCRECQKDAKKK